MKSKAFTLIELLVVISIIGILSSIVLVSFQGQRERAEIARGQQFDAQISHGLGAYAVGIWRFESISGSKVFDESGYGNDGIINGNPVAIDSGVYSGTKALQLDGTGDYINCGQSPSLSITGGITIEAWIKWDGIGNPYFVTKTADTLGTRSYDLSGNVSGLGDGLLEFRTGDEYCDTLVSTGATFNLPNINGWTHLVGTYKPSEYVRIYVNGILAEENTTSIPASQCDNGLDWYIGAREGNQGFFNGCIDDVRIYDHALTSAQIQQHYAASALKYGIAIK